METKLIEIPATGHAWQHHEATYKTVHHEAVTHTVHHEGICYVEKEIQGTSYQGQEGTQPGHWEFWEEHMFCNRTDCNADLTIMYRNGELEDPTHHSWDVHDGAAGWYDAFTRVESFYPSISDEYAKTYWVVDQPEYDEVIVDVPAYDEEVIDQPEHWNCSQCESVVYAQPED